MSVDTARTSGDLSAFLGYFVRFIPGTTLIEINTDPGSPGLGVLVRTYQIGTVPYGEYTDGPDIQHVVAGGALVLGDGITNDAAGKAVLATGDAAIHGVAAKGAAIGELALMQPFDESDTAGGEAPGGDIVYISAATSVPPGSDITGDGSAGRPYLTIDHAMRVQGPARVPLVYQLSPDAFTVTGAPVAPALLGTSQTRDERRAANYVPATILRGTMVEQVAFTATGGSTLAVINGLPPQANDFYRGMFLQQDVDASIHPDLVVASSVGGTIVVKSEGNFGASEAIPDGTALSLVKPGTTLNVNRTWTGKESGFQFDSLNGAFDREFVGGYFDFMNCVISGGFTAINCKTTVASCVFTPGSVVSIGGNESDYVAFGNIVASVADGLALFASNSRLLTISNDYRDCFFGLKYSDASFTDDLIDGNFTGFPVDATIDAKLSRVRFLPAPSGNANPVRVLGAAKAAISADQSVVRLETGVIDAFEGVAVAAVQSQVQFQSVSGTGAATSTVATKLDNDSVYLESDGGGGPSTIDAFVAGNVVKVGALANSSRAAIAYPGVVHLSTLCRASTAL